MNEGSVFGVPDKDPFVQWLENSERTEEEIKIWLIKDSLRYQIRFWKSVDWKGGTSEG